MAGNLGAASRCKELLGGNLWHLFGPASILFRNIFKISDVFNHQQSRSCPLAISIDSPYFFATAVVEFSEV